MFVLNENMIEALSDSDLQVILESYDSLPKNMKNHIAVNIRPIIKRIYNDKIYMYEMAEITSMLESDDVEVIADPSYSTLQSQISIIKNKIDECGCDQSTLNDIKKLCDVECYDLNSYILFDIRCNEVCDSIINTSNTDEDKLKAIEIINIDITAFKFNLLSHINYVNNQHIDTPTANYNDYNRIFTIYKHIVSVLEKRNHTELLQFNSLLSMYSKITGNSVNRFMYQLSIDITPEDELIEESTIDTLYNIKMKPIEIPSFGKLMDYIEDTQLCLEESGRLILGDNIFLDDTERKNVYTFLNKMTEAVITKIVHAKISFQLTETDCMIIFDNESYDMLTTVIYMSDGETRYLGKYEGVIYVLFKIIGKNKMYGLNIDNKSIIEISNSDADFQYKYDM